jgi:hypothetical protein
MRLTPTNTETVASASGSAMVQLMQHGQIATFPEKRELTQNQSP